MDNKMFCFQCEQTVACTGAAVSKFLTSHLLRTRANGVSYSFKLISVQTATS